MYRKKISNPNPDPKTLSFFPRLKNKQNVIFLPYLEAPGGSWLLPL